MLLDISKIKQEPGSTLPFEVSLDLSDLTFCADCRAAEPVRAIGTVRNTAGVFVLQGELRATMQGSCDRCARSVTREMVFPLHAVLASELTNDDGEEDPWLFLLQGDEVDLGEILTTTFVLGMDAQFLCSDDCKGLCPVCGRDLNLGPCDCKPEPDPRLAVLKQLLKEKE